ncbi:MAG: hypothetical protein MZW92_31135 [Comamonadaceae bacterium]|nr:hypothetical protein [Comamonadaceae bacterium]
MRSLISQVLPTVSLRFEGHAENIERDDHDAVFLQEARAADDRFVRHPSPEILRPVFFVARLDPEEKQFEPRFGEHRHRRLIEEVDPAHDDIRNGHLLPVAFAEILDPSLVQRESLVEELEILGFVVPR